MRAPTSPLLLLPLLLQALPPMHSLPLPTLPPRSTRSAAALLVVRAACPPPLRHLLQEERLSLASISARSLHILSYEETCGVDWARTVSRASLAALSEERAVLLAGWPGAHVCAVLAAAAGVLRRAQGGACAVGGARHAALVRLAQRLRWHRALLPPAGAAPISCGATLRDAARALGAAGLQVRRAPLTGPELSLLPHVVIVCASGSRQGMVHAAGAAGVGPALLVLPADGTVLLADGTVLLADGTVLPSDRNAPHRGNNEPFQFGNNSLTINESLYIIKDKRSNLSMEEIATGGKVRNSTFLTTRPGVSRPGRVNNDSKMDAVRSRSIKVERVHVNKVQRESSESLPDGYTNISDGPVFGLSHNFHLSRSVDVIDSIFSPQQISFFRCKLLLSDEEIYPNSSISEQIVMDKIKELIREESQSVDSRVEHNRMDFHVYEWWVEQTRWRRVGLLAVASRRAMHVGAEWQHAAHWAHAGAALDRCAATAVEETRGDGGLTAPVAAGACCVLLAVCGAGVLARCWARRRRRELRRAGVVLDATDFTFPAEERRRVGEGVEAALACWLQQLHELGASEQPGAVCQAALSTPRVPSAPSSTCSVNRVAGDRHVRYKGELVHLKYLSADLELRRQAIDVLLVMQNLRHENINPFLGYVREARALAWSWCARGSLQDVLRADAVALDWTFRLSLLTDVVRGMRHLHASALRLHGRLSSRNCLVDARWLLRLSDHGLALLVPPLAPPSAADLLWTAPELLRDPAAPPTQPADVYSFGIIMQEVIVRGEPYCMLPLTPEEIVDKLRRPPPLVRPSVSLGAAPPEAVRVMRQCWSEAPELRPDFPQLHDTFRLLHKGRKVNVVDSMFDMLEKYSNNLEELVRERTEQLDMEKKKTEQLLNRMLPRSVAERLVLGQRVEPEEVPDVSVYFSDVVGFTALAARSTPLQVALLLNELYSTFDAVVERHGVYKVETIGDAYMVVGGLFPRAADHAARVADMALRLLHEAGSFRVRHLPATRLPLRCGVHSGPVCAAVVGLSMPRYCLFGDTVNTASRMESTGAAWRIQVSAATAERLQAVGGYRLRSRGLTQVKGKGAMHTYWLLGKDGFDRHLPTPPPLEDEEVLFETEGDTESDVCRTSEYPPTAEGRTAQEASPPDRQSAVTWRQAGALSEDCNYGAAPHSRYRCLGEAQRGVRRQWSLERGDMPSGRSATGSLSAPPSPPSPLLLGAAPNPRVPRYRTRPTDLLT